MSVDLRKRTTVSLTKSRPVLMGATHSDRQYWQQELGSNDPTALQDFYAWCRRAPKRNRRYV